MKNSLHSFDSIHAAAAADPVCEAPTRLDNIRRCWAQPSQFPPLKDGTLIIAVGRVIYDLTVPEDSFEPGTDLTIGKCCEPFAASVRWTENPGELAGWHYADGLAVARTLDDKVIIDFWNPDPREHRTDVRHPELPGPVLEHGTWEGRPK